MQALVDAASATYAEDGHNSALAQSPEPSSGIFNGCSSPSSTGTAQKRSGETTDEVSRKRPKQTRNKPTLSCEECVNHKTKCDRGRPVCLACLKRSSTCQYSSIANVLAATGDTRQRRRKSSTKAPDLQVFDDPQSSLAPPPPRSSIHIADITNPPSDDARSPIVKNASQWKNTSPQRRLPPLSDGLTRSTESAFTPFPPPGSINGKRPSLFGHAGLLPSMHNAPMSVFGASDIGGEHPFANYWTCKGGLAEVIRVLPSKEQADILVARYFEIIDPIYPILDRPEFLKEYERFWSLSHEDKHRYDAATVSLHFIIYAAATQYINFEPPSERRKAAEFYISAGHQAIRISSYLNRMTITTVQSMLLIFYFLVHDNHIADAWTFSGITQRQAYVLQLNREPSLVVPNASPAEKNMRCKLWAALIFQESSIALSLRLPSTSLQSDVGPHSLSYDEADKTTAFNQSLENGEPAISKLCSDLTKTDISYCKSIWAYSSFVQENVCRPRALGLPICQSNEHKRDMISAFRSLYRSFPQPFGSYDPKRFEDPSRRVVRQQILLTASFFHAMTLICADKNVQSDVITDSCSTFESAHEALGAFFAFNANFGDETNAWWTMQHNAFEQAMLVADLLAETKPVESMPGMNGGMSREFEMLQTAKKDVKQLLNIMRASRGYFEFQEMLDRRIDTLRAVYDNITVVPRRPRSAQQNTLTRAS